jgi:threonine aldolase
VSPIEALAAIRVAALEQGLPVHMDGARLWNASAASGVPLAKIASYADTVMVAFSKGLGAPIGAALAGTRHAMEKAWTARKLFGGAMRQSGILAAAVLYALDHQLDRLADDHANARTIAEIVHGAGGARVVPPDTNIVMVDLTSANAPELVARAHELDILLSEWSPTRIRMVTHLDVSADDCRRAATVLRDLLTA